MSSLPVKILLCETEAGALEKLNRMPADLPGHFIINESVAEKIKRNIAVFRPDVLLTDNQFWLREDANEIISSLRTPETLPIIVWASAMNDTILSSIFKGSNIHFVKQSDDATLLSDTLTRSFISSQ